MSVSIPADSTVDTTGLKCPLPVLKARKALEVLHPGERLLLISDDPLAAIDVPHFCNETGHSLVQTLEDGGTLSFLIAKA